MKLLTKKIISTLLVCLFAVTALDLPVFAEPITNYVTSSSPIISNTLIPTGTSTDYIPQSELLQAEELAKKLYPYVKDGNISLSEDDMLALGITDNELSDIKQGLELGKTCVSVDVNTYSTDGNLDIMSSNIPNVLTGDAYNPDVSVKINSSGVTINLSSFDIKVLLTLGVAAGIILAVVGALCGWDEVVIIGGCLFYATDLMVAAGAILSGVCSIISIWWAGSSISVFVSKSVFINHYGTIVITRSGKKYYKYIRF